MTTKFEIPLRENWDVSPWQVKENFVPFDRAAQTIRHFLMLKEGSLLISGPRGVGKTTLMRWLKKEYKNKKNQPSGQPVELIELDASEIGIVHDNEEATQRGILIAVMGRLLDWLKQKNDNVKACQQPATEKKTKIYWLQRQFHRRKNQQQITGSKSDHDELQKELDEIFWMALASKYQESASNAATEQNKLSANFGFNLFDLLKIILPNISISAKLNASTVRSSDDAKRILLSFSNDIGYIKRRFREWLQKFEKKSRFSLPTIIVDELDTVADLSATGSEVDKEPVEDAVDLCFKNDTVRKKLLCGWSKARPQHLLEAMASMKNLFTVCGIKFIFIAGPRVHMCVLSYDNSNDIFHTLFTHRLYLTYPFDCENGPVYGLIKRLHKSEEGVDKNLVHHLSMFLLFEEGPYFFDTKRALRTQLCQSDAKEEWTVDWKPNGVNTLKALAGEALVETFNGWRKEYIRSNRPNPFVMDGIFRCLREHVRKYIFTVLKEQEANSSIVTLKTRKIVDTSRYSMVGSSELSLCLCRMHALYEGNLKKLSEEDEEVKQLLMLVKNLIMEKMVSVFEPLGCLIEDISEKGEETLRKQRMENGDETLRKQKFNLQDPESEKLFQSYKAMLKQFEDEKNKR